MKILIIEDNKNLANAIVRVLKQKSYSSAHFTNGFEAQQYWVDNTKDIDLVILDIQLPGKNGVEICQTIRALKIMTPVIMLTAKQQTKDKIYGLNNGADDYLTKPFEFPELLARIQALLRRPKILNQSIIALGDNINFNASARCVTKNKQIIALTPKEFEILNCLIRHKNIVLSQQQIFNHCFDFAKDNWSNTIEVHIKNLRKKLFNQNDKNILKTVRGFGYRLEIK